MKTIKFNYFVAFALVVLLIACEKEITYERGVNDLYLYSITDDTTSQITDNTNIGGSFSFSPDSKKIYYLDHKNIYSINLDGTGKTSISIPSLMHFDLSSDGKKIAYNDEKFRLFLINSDGANKQLLVDSREIYSLKWSPDGEKILCFLSNNELGIVTLDGNIKTITSNFNSFIPEEVWSSDAKKIVFSKYDSNKIEQIYIYNLINDSVIQITHSLKPCSQAIWNPIKNEIVYSIQSKKDVSDLMIMNSDGTEQKTLIKQGSFLSLHWAKDGTQISFMVSDSIKHEFNFAIIDKNGNDFRIINKIHYDCSEHLWSPDSKYIIYHRILFTY